jgi:maleate isomerase
MTDLLSRIGLIVPSSNTTMETELPLMFGRRGSVASERYTFHSSRARMRQVNAEELAAMVAASERCAAELADARVDVIAYACLVAVMAQGEGAHLAIEQRLSDAAAEAGAAVPVVSSAGALVAALAALDAERIAVIAPYMKPLTSTVCGYIGQSGPEVVRSISLEVSDNLEVGRLDPQSLIAVARDLDTSDIDALVLSACVQMPSLDAIKPVEDLLGVPVVTAASATAFAVLRALGRPAVVPDAGHLLSGVPALPTAPIQEVS